jgi:hypothetical protein
LMRVSVSSSKRADEARVPPEQRTGLFWLEAAV